jgi:hypothetical protein
MNTEAFNKLLLLEKAGVIELKGKFIGERSIYNKSYIKLYQVNEFFVEVFSNVNTDELQQIITTTQDEILYNYIDLREVYLTNKQIKPPQQ